MAQDFVAVAFARCASHSGRRTGLASLAISVADRQAGKPALRIVSTKRLRSCSDQFEPAGEAFDGDVREAAESPRDHRLGLVATVEHGEGARFHDEDDRPRLSSGFAVSSRKASSYRPTMK